MVGLFRQQSPLPWKSPHVPPSATFQPLHALPPTVLGSIRGRPAALGALAILSTFLLLTYVTPLTSYYSSAFDPHLSPFPKKGLAPALFRALDQIDHRAAVLHPVERPFEKERRQWDPVPWSTEDLLPPRSKGSARRQAAALALGSDATGDVGGAELALRTDQDPVPEHTIPVLPRKVVLTPNSPGVGAHVPDPSKMLLGIVTTVERAKMMSQLWQHFMVPRYPEEESAPNCLILLNSKEDPEDVQELRDLLEARGLPCGVRFGKYERYEVRVLSMIKEMKDYASDTGKSIDWFVFGDDDTFWLDMRTLRRVLSKYDPGEEWFVGATTEAQRQLEQFGRMAFGGAGMLVSRTLMSNLYARWDECHDRYKDVFGGDEMLSRCAALVTGRTKQTITTEERGMHQFDIPGDCTGVFQSGIPIVSMHHFMASGWVHLFGYGSLHPELGQILRVRDAAAFLGGDNAFSRHVFGDGKWLLVHGYSLTYHQEKLKKEDMALMEHTWYEGYPLSFEDRRHIQERHDPDGLPAKQTFYIEVLTPNTALFTYLQADSWDEHMPATERVRIQILWDGDGHRSVREPDAAALSRP
ncbi:hypothetical protein JCM8097_009384 [Rhodosporidiobolus ruineniae]